MSKKIFANLPVANLDAAKVFYQSLGWTLNEQFTNEQAACIVISEEIYAMLLVNDFFSTFISQPIVDAHKQTEVLLALSCDSRQEVDDQMVKAIAAGGHEHRPIQDLGFMYSRSFQDLDGHVWELFYMDISQFPAQN